MSSWFTHEIFIAFGTFLGVIGSGIRWAFIRMDRRAAQIEERQDRMNEILRQTLEARIDELVERNTELSNRLTQYVRHVGVIEGLMRANNIDVPPMRD